MKKRALPVIPIQINVNRHEATVFLPECLISIKSQVGLGTEYEICLHLCLYGGAEKNQVLRTVKKSLGSTKHRFLIVKEDIGYGQKQNLLFQAFTKKVQKADCFLTLNPDVILHRECILILYRKFASDPSRNLIVEARQFPVENPPRIYDPKSFEVPWSCGACILISSQFYSKINGFDENFYLYCEDVDLSWQAWLQGGSCIYCLNAICIHITRSIFENTGVQAEIKPQDRHSLLSHLLLSWKYFGHNERYFKKCVRMFQEYPTANETKQKIWENFSLLKTNIQPLEKSHRNINIYGFGLYHRVRL